MAFGEAFRETLTKKCFMGKPPVVIPVEPKGTGFPCRICADPVIQE
jgi:hypothetical protein